MIDDLDPFARYCPRFCEENVWHLCDALSGTIAEALVLMVSSPSQRVLVFHQRASQRPEGYVAWDYHVVLAVREADDWWIVDADTDLPTPCPADEYLRASFPPLPASAARYRPAFRVIAAPRYHATLASDRHHMRDASGDWLSPPPAWPQIGQGHNLDRLVDMNDSFVGDVLDLPALHRRLGLDPPG